MEYPDIAFQLQQRSDEIAAELAKAAVAAAEVDNADQEEEGNESGPSGVATKTADSFTLLNTDVDEVDTLDLARLPTKQISKVSWVK